MNSTIHFDGVSYGSLTVLPHWTYGSVTTQVLLPSFTGGTILTSEGALVNVVVVVRL
jgi:hypothetical protein